MIIAGEVERAAIKIFEVRKQRIGECGRPSQVRGVVARAASFESRPPLRAHQPDGARERCQPQVRVVNSQQQPVLGGYDPGEYASEALVARTPYFVMARTNAGWSTKS